MPVKALGRGEVSSLEGRRAQSIQNNKTTNLHSLRRPSTYIPPNIFSKYQLKMFFDEIHIT